MPEKKTIERARRDKREGKSPSTQAGEFVREEIERIRGGAHGARSAKQAIAIGLSEARRAGVKLPPPEKGSASSQTRRKAERDLEAGEKPKARTSAKRSRATTNALKRERKSSVSKSELSQHAKAAAKERSASDRSQAAKKAARTRARNKSASAKSST